VAVREAEMAHGHGFADYLLFVNGKAVGAIEAKPAGHLKHHRREFAGPGVEVGQHQQQSLGGGEAGGERAGLQGAMECPSTRSPH